MSIKSRLAKLEEQAAKSNPAPVFVVVDWGGDTISFKDENGHWVELTRAEYEAKYPVGPDNPIINWDDRTVINIKDTEE